MSFAPWKRREVIGDATLYLGDCLEILPHLPKVDAVITDPPYSSGGMFRGDRLVDVHRKYITDDSENNDVPGFSGDSRDMFGHWYWQALWLAKVRQIATPGAVAAVFCDWRQIVAAIGSIQAGGWIYRGIAHWHKPNARPIQGRFTNACEYIAWGTNGPRPLNYLGGNAIPGHWSATAPQDRQHITQKPIAVMEGLVRAANPGGLVVDAFMGSGTTGVACMNLGRKFIGIEIDAVHFDVACERIENAQRQGRLIA